jgi:hypothetical protein
MRTELWIASAIAACAVTVPALGHAYCRTTTCQATTTHPCIQPEQGCLTEGIPISWPVDCVSYDLNQDASHWVPLGVATEVADRAFRHWTEVTCPGSANGPAITLLDRGPIACGAHEYNSNSEQDNRYGGNANIIVFRDGGWNEMRAGDPASTLALTTVTFDLNSGEIFDADIEINGEKRISADAVPPADSYDLESIITHEAGHFLGLSHSRVACTSLACPTMNASYVPGSTDFRTLEADDIAGICAIYPPGRGAPRTACTPNFGLSTVCGTAATKSSGCSAAPVGPRETPWAGVGLAAALVCLVRRRREPC